jgi:hypothetical protein
MLRWKLAGVAAVVAVAVLGSVSVVMAQAQAPRGGRQGRGQFDPAQMNQWMMQRMKEQLGATDDEWAVIEPRLEKVQTLARDARSGGMGGMFGRGQFGGPGGGRGQPGGAAPQPPQGAQPTAPQSAVSKAAEDLRTTLGDQNSTVAQVKEKLTAYRAEREKAREELSKAQEDLRSVLSVKQEAQLVLMGSLD